MLELTMKDKRNQVLILVNWNNATFKIIKAKKETMIMHKLPINDFENIKPLI